MKNFGSESYQLVALLILLTILIALFGTEVIDVQIHDTYFVIEVKHFGDLLGFTLIVNATLFYFSKDFLLHKALKKVYFLLVFLCIGLQLVITLQSMIYSGLHGDLLTVLLFLLCIILSQIVFATNLVYALVKGRKE